MSIYCIASVPNDVFDEAISKQPVEGFLFQKHQIDMKSMLSTLHALIW